MAERPDPQEPQDVERIVADLEADVARDGDDGSSTGDDSTDGTSAADDLTDSVPGAPEPPD